MADNTGGQLSLFAVGSRASPIVSPGSKAAQMMTVHSGQKCSESFGKFSQWPSLLKTCLGSSIWNSTKCYLIWKVKTSPANRLIFRLQVSTPTTYAIESGLLPTPAASEYGSNQGGGSGRVGPKRPGLSQIARMIPTPTAGDAKSSGSRNTETSAANAGVSLTDYVRGDGGKGRADGSPASPPSGQLNPAWVEYLMGFPTGWTDSER